MDFRCKRHSPGIATRILAAVIALWSISGCAPGNTSPEARAARSICAAVPAQSVIVIGELHGTAEAPGLFRELVDCRKNQARGALLVGLEIPPEALAAVMQLPTDATTAQARHPLSGNGFWKKARDGRTSIANLELIEYLRAGQKDGKLAVFAFDRRRSATDNFSELATEAVKNALSQSGPGGSRRDVLMLTGNGHATMATDNGSLGRGLAAAGMRPYIFQTTFASGQAWVCRMGQCGISPAGSGGCDSPASADIKIGDSTVHTVCLPVATASPPAMPDDVSVGAGARP